MNKNKDKLVITQPINPIPVAILAESIVEIAEAMRKINSTNLNRRALLVLLKDASGVSMVEIQNVLNKLADLDKLFCK